jgi:hypothetical protein
MASRNKLLVRVWLPGRGCCHLRSPAMTDAEASSLIDSASDAIEEAQVSTNEIQRIRGTQDLAYVIARRSPDPDHPSRDVPGFALISIPDQVAFFHQAVANLLRDVKVPTTSDYPPEDWTFFNHGKTTSEATDGAGGETRPAIWRGIASVLTRHPVKVVGLLIGFLTRILLRSPWKQPRKRNDRTTTRSNPSVPFREATEKKK